MIWKKILSYVNIFGKKQPIDTNDTSSRVSLKLMHGINRISILIFLVGLIIIVYRLIAK